VGILKFALLATGMIGGAYLSVVVFSALWLFIAIAVAGSAYIMLISFSRKNST
jgi:hypothetical protein